MHLEREEAHKNIKKYLIENGVEVEEVYMWQDGTEFGAPMLGYEVDPRENGLSISTVVIVNGIEERYAIPRYLVERKEGAVKFLKRIKK